MVSSHVVSRCWRGSRVALPLAPLVAEAEPSLHALQPHPHLALCAGPAEAAGEAVEALLLAPLAHDAP